MALITVLAAAPLDAQPSVVPADSRQDSTSQERSITRRSVTIGGQRIEYEARFDNIVLTNPAGEQIAKIFYTAYSKLGVTDVSRRPITFAYNGGPGSSSIMLHMGALGPRRVVLRDTAHLGGPPYTLADNQFSLLDKSDLVFVDPVGTGISRMIGKGTPNEFFGIDEDANSQLQFLIKYLTLFGRWNSPRYLVGESYGTTRVVALASLFQRNEFSQVNGIALISSALNYQAHRFSPGLDLPYTLFLPSYAAIAWYQRTIPDRPPELTPFLREVERFATTEYAQALDKGTALEASERGRILDRLHRYTGLSTSYLDKADLRVDAPHFYQELLRDRGLLVGRQDGRFVGPIGDRFREVAAYDISSAALFTGLLGAFNHYLYWELGFRNKAHPHYVMHADPPFWNSSHRSPTRGDPPQPDGRANLAVDLADLLNRNPRLLVQVHSGRYDVATPYFASRWTMDHMTVSPETRRRVEEIEYDSGHAMYVWEPALVQLRRKLVELIDKTSGGAEP